MIKERIDGFSQDRSKMASDINTLITDGEDLLKAAANVSGAGFAAAREKFDEKLSSAKARLVDASRPAVDTARRTAAAANGYVHDSPWTVIGVAAAAAAAAGILIGFLATRR